MGAPACAPLTVWVNDGCNGVEGVPVTFRTVNGGGLVDGENQITINTGVTGHAEAAYIMGPAAGNQLIEMDFPGNTGSPVAFTMFGLTRDVSLPTSFSGLVIDNAGRPIEGATCTITVNGQTVPSTTSNADGIFAFTGIPDGPGDLEVDGRVATGLNGQPIAAAIAERQTNLVTQPGQINNDIPNARSSQRLKMILNQCLTPGPEECLRVFIGEGTHTLPTTGRQNHGFHRRTRYPFQARLSPRLIHKLSAQNCTKPAGTDIIAALRGAPALCPVQAIRPHSGNKDR